MEQSFFYRVDLAEIALWAFTIFFFGLIFYLRKEDRREGYPLESDTTGRPEDSGVVWMPEKKTFKTKHGEFSSGQRDERPIAARRLAVWSGAPMEPTGNAMREGVGPAAYADRADTPDMTWEGEPKLAPLRALPDFFVEEDDTDPRGMAVVAADGKVAGTICDIWVDRSEMLARYYEVELPQSAPPAPVATSKGEAAPTPAPAQPTAQRVLLPTSFADLKASAKQVEVTSILASQFADVPATKTPDQVTLLEEDKICGYFGGGLLYATPARAEALI